LKILIYSDVHGNLPAFEKMLKTEGACDQYICLGDLVNYGPWSNECVDLAVSLSNSKILMGNHELAYINGFYLGSNPLAQAFFNKTYPNFDRIDLIKSFNIELCLDKYICQHTLNDLYVYPDTQIDLNMNYIIGHSHHQFYSKSNNYILYNTGSVGQNRKFINIINYLTYDTEKKIISMKSIEYNLDLLINEMKRLSYSEECLKYYLTKPFLNINFTS
jgi:predicted phosphodiesterase